MAKATWIVEYLDNTTKKITKVLADDAESAMNKVLERVPHAIIKRAELAVERKTN